MRCDLHVHTALSACADNSMSPRRVAETAAARGIGLLAVTDHNASAHALACGGWASRLGLRLLPAIEVASREEVHLLVFLPTFAALADFQSLVDASLPDQANLPEIFGHQPLYDRDSDQIVDVDQRLRQVGCSLSIDRLALEVHERGGVIVPAHIDRPRYGLIRQLGLVDEAAGYDGLEIAWPTWRGQGCSFGDQRSGYPLLTGSDAHFLDDIGRGAMDLPERREGGGRLAEMLFDQ